MEEIMIIDSVNHVSMLIETILTQLYMKMASRYFLFPNNSLPLSRKLWLLSSDLEYLVCELEYTWISFRNALTALKKSSLGRIPFLRESWLFSTLMSQDRLTRKCSSSLRYSSKNNLIFLDSFFQEPLPAT